VKYVATIHVRPRPEVRDPQGEAVAGALRSLGFRVEDVRAGKELVVRFEAADEEGAEAAVHRMGDDLLANPVIEEYAVQLRTLAMDPAR
jgi:phosphoribosylformylglycinamidine synthase subunit PurS